MSYPRTKKYGKLHPLAAGPYPVIKVSHLEGTIHLTGVTLDIGSNGAPRLETFARERIHPFSYVHRDVRWNRIAEFTQLYGGGGPQPSPLANNGGVDHNTLLRGAGRQLDQPGVRDSLEDMPDQADFLHYLNNEELISLSDGGPSPSLGEACIDLSDGGPSPSLDEACIDLS